MNEQQPFFQDDEDDTLLFNRLREYVLDHYPNPERVGCLDRATLEAWVFAPTKLDLSDPKYLHVFKCAECTRTLIELRAVREAARISDTAASAARVRGRKHLWQGLAVAFTICCLLILGGIFWRTYSNRFTADNRMEAAVSRTIDLSHAGQPRGGENSFAASTLPRGIVALHLILPFYSPGGSYRVAVATDRNAASERVHADAVASTKGPQADLSVNLDLRHLDSGTYYLATTHQGDPSSYYYPLTVH